jgi:cytochrome c oxidase subunit II
VILRIFRQIFRLPPAASSFADAVDWLHFFVVGTTLVGVLVITLLTGYLVIRYRERTPNSVTPRLVVSGTREAMLIAGTLGLFVLWWVLGYRIYLDMERRPQAAVTVYVSAKQWMWKFSYADGRISNDSLTVPLGRPVELIMTSRDVIHSFFVPAMRVKQDVLPGRYVSLWFKPVRAGTYSIFCAEYCGVSHSRMLGEVRVLGPDAYSAWLEDSSHTRPLAEVGREAALRHACFSCHTVDGQPHIGPTWSRLYGSTVTLEGGEHVLADAAYLTESIMDPAARIVTGYRPVMPSYLGSLDSAEAAAIVEYMRSLAQGPIMPTIKLPENAIPPALAPATSSAREGTP